MANVIIHNCTMRVVRRDGWSWGADPQRLLQAAVRVLPELIARRIGDLLSDDVDREISATVRIRLPVRLDELLALSVEAPVSGAGPPNASFNSLRDRIEAVLHSALPVEAAHEIHITEEEEFKHSGPSLEDLTEAEQTRRDTVLRVLISWRERGALEMLLSMFSQPALELWHDHILKQVADPAGAADVSEEAITNMIAVMTDPVVHSSMLDRPALLRLRLSVVVGASADMGIPPSHPALVDAMDRALPLTGDVKASGCYTPNGEEHARLLPEEPAIATGSLSPATAPASDARHGSPSPSALRSAEVYVSSALPFLMLGPLSRTGYLETLVACLEAADLIHELPGFATALAFKVLNPPQRGWRRLPADVISAAAFAGLHEPISGPRLALLAGKLSASLSALDAILAGSLIEGHDTREPLLLQRADFTSCEGYLLVDVDGFFPVAWSASLDGLLPVLARFGSSTVLIPQGSENPELFSRLNLCGHCFITDAPPARHEPWQPLSLSAAGRFWTNGVASSRSTLVEHALHFAGAAEETESLWREMAEKRPSVPPSAAHTFECSLILAASAALGTIAWTLWRERGPVSPLLALERFHDLDARICFTSSSIRVRLPLGRRHQDLYKHRLLEDVAEVPWFDGRVLQFSGG